MSRQPGHRAYNVFLIIGAVLTVIGLALSIGGR